MFKVSHPTLIFISGIVWLLIGCFLLPLGLNFIVGALLTETSSHPILSFFGPYMGGVDQAALLLIAFGLALGFVKGRFVFAKTVKRSINRILSLPNPVSLGKIYSPQYYLLLGSMIFLGIMVRYLPLDVRGVVDVIIGCALINGSVLYFREGWAVRREAQNNPS